MATPFSVTWKESVSTASLCRSDNAYITSEDFANGALATAMKPPWGARMNSKLRTRAVTSWAAPILTLLFIAGCDDIWNAGDLVEWVNDEAVKQGCRRDSIELEEWYRKDAAGNIWHGSCVTGVTGRRMRFGINVDSVWKPSA